MTPDAIAEIDPPALLLTLRLAWKRSFGLLQVSAAAFVIFMVFLSKPDIWADAYSFGRTLSPLLIWLALLAISSRFWWNLLPLGMVVPRILFQLNTQFPGILRGLLSEIR